jgi:hypothetical protein
VRNSEAIELRCTVDDGSYVLGGAFKQAPNTTLTSSTQTYEMVPKMGPRTHHGNLYCKFEMLVITNGGDGGIRTLDTDVNRITV